MSNGKEEKREERMKKMTRARNRGIQISLCAREQAQRQLDIPLSKRKRMTQMKCIKKRQSHADFSFYFLFFGRDSNVAGRQSKGNQAVFNPEHATCNIPPRHINSSSTWISG